MAANDRLADPTPIRRFNSEEITNVYVMHPTDKNLGYYCQKLSRLNVNRSRDRGIAPHKPILLLSVIDLIERSVLRHNQIFLDPELIATFLKFWSQLGSEAHQADIALPFFHLRGDGFWHFKAALVG